MTRNDVLIIGAGPSGLFAAAELARHGVAARLIEREVRPHREARATAIQPGTLEILDTVGLLPPLLDAAEHVRCSRLYDPDMAELGATSYERLDCRCPLHGVESLEPVAVIGVSRRIFWNAVCKKRVIVRLIGLPAPAPKHAVDVLIT